MFVIKAGCLFRGKAHASPGSSFVVDVVRASSVCKVQGSLALTEEHPNQFPLRKEMGPLFSLLRSDDAIDFIVELEKRGSGGFMEPRERTLKKNVISYLPPHKSEEVNWPWLNPTLLSNSMTNFKNKVTSRKPATSVNISCLFHTKLLSHQNCDLFWFVPKALATLLQKSF